ncbi:TolC family protein [Derxia gummosa]|uniref:TolC family protein n=1 Tax=Derxia gummosa DSM 723 TaxID=1121388 RepID=A0A9U5GKN7_9BURK|nr:TolC family protein [Derxia gummosa]
MFPIPPRRLRATVVVVACALAGCAAPRPDAALYDLDADVRLRTGHDLGATPASLAVPADASALRASAAVAPAAAAGAMPAAAVIGDSPLDVDTAIALALARNPGLRADLAELLVADADLAQASRLRNPQFGFSRLVNSEGVDIDRSVMFDLVGLLTRGLRRDIEQRRFDRARLVAADAAVRLALDTRRAWIEAVAARQALVYARQAVEAAEASAELGRRMVAAGNWPRLSLLREQAFLADTRARLQRAELAATATRERLARLIGLEDVRPAGMPARGEAPGTAALAAGAGPQAAEPFPRLPDRLPPLPVAALDLPHAEQTALDNRLDVQAARLDAEAAARDLGLARATRFINVAEVGYINRSKPGEPRADGYEISLELPLFDQGDARRSRAEALYWQRLQRTAQLAVDARSQVREAHARYRAGWQLAARYRDELLPLRQQIAEENLLRYNAMFVDVFTLLVDAREQIEAVTGAIETERDFWLAEADLQAAIGRPLPAAPPVATAPRSASGEAPPPPVPAHDHAHPQPAPEHDHAH